MSQLNEDRYLILETTYWKTFLISDQTYLGRSVVTLKRQDCGDLANITEEEMLDFLKIVQILENAFRRAFNATMFNWACLMNNAYQNTPPDPHVHWHFKPRYDHTVTFAGLEFTDPNFGQHYTFPTNRDVGEIKELIVKEVKKYI